MDAPRLPSLLERLNLEPIGEDRFLAHTPNDGRKRVFGGLVAAQALRAASLTVSEKLAHSFHSYFLRPGDPRQPIELGVDRIRDGRSFATRRVVATQGKEAIFNLSASFHVDEPGLSHQSAMPEAPPPEELPTNAERLVELDRRTENPLFDFLVRLERPIEHRDPDWVDLVDPAPREGPKRLWLRAAGEMPNDPTLHRCVLTYATDMGLLDNCINRHGHSWLTRELMIASLDHAVWFHRPFRADDWLLYVMESPSAAGGRGFNSGRIYARDGTLIASTAQESLMRGRKK